MASMAQDRILWVFARSNTVSTQIFDELQMLEEQTRSLQFVCTALDTVEFDAHRMAELRHNPALCGVIMPLEIQGVNDPLYLEMLEWCVKEVLRRDDFRLFIYLHDISFDEMDKRGKDGNPEVFTDLRDAVEINKNSDLKSLCSDIQQYLDKINDIRNEMYWRQLHLPITIAASKVAMVIQLFCMVLVPVIVFSLLIWNISPASDVLTNFMPLIAIICGVAAFPLLMIGVFRNPIDQAKKPRTVFFIYVLLVVLMGSIGLPLHLQIPKEWLALGVVVGGIVDSIRRAGLQAQRASRAIHTHPVLQGDELSKRLVDAAGENSSNPWRCPLVPVKLPNIFISYAHGSSWAENLSEQLYKELSDVGARPFLDRKDIPAGLNWRRVLNRALGDAGVCVVLVDSVSVLRKFCALEVETALEGRYISGLPHLIIITSPDLANQKSEEYKWYSIFRTVLTAGETLTHEGKPVISTAPAGNFKLEPTAQSRSLIGGQGLQNTVFNTENRKKSANWHFRIIYLSGENTAKALALLLDPKSYKSTAVIPEFILDLFGVIWTIPFYIMLVMTAMSGFIGLLLGIFAVGELITGSASGMLLRDIDLLGPMFLILSLWLGISLRHTVAARFQVLESSDSRGLVGFHLIATLGVGFFLLRWLTYVTPLTLAWAMALGVIGWNYVSKMMTTNLRFVRPSQFT